MAVRNYKGLVEGDELSFKILFRQKVISWNEITAISFRNIDAVTYECVFIVLALQDDCSVSFNELDNDLEQVEKLLKAHLSIEPHISVVDFIADSDGGDTMAVFKTV